MAPDASTRRHEITSKYFALKTVPVAVSKLDDWFSNWTRITTIGKSMIIPETGGIRPQEDFLVACKVLDQDYAMTCLRELYMPENAGTTDALPSLDYYLAEIIAFLRRNKPQLSGFSVAASSLEVAKSFNKKPTGASKNRRNGKPIPECFYGSRHWYADCFIINEDHHERPHFYPKSEVLHRVELARRDPKIEAKISAALQRW